MKYKVTVVEEVEGGESVVVFEQRVEQVDLRALAEILNKRKRRRRMVP